MGVPPAVSRPLLTLDIFSPTQGAARILSTTTNTSESDVSAFFYNQTIVFSFINVGKCMCYDTTYPLAKAALILRLNWVQDSVVFSTPSRKVLGLILQGLAALTALTPSTPT